MHGFLSREGIPPAGFLEISREQLAQFPDVQLFGGRVTAIEREGDGFRIHVDDNRRFRAPVVLLATGILDELPDLPGIKELYGISVHHCPYCDGWEHRDEPIAIYGKGDTAVELAEEMPLWSRDLLYFSDGIALPPSARDRLETAHIGIVETGIRTLHGSDGCLKSIELEDGTRIERRSMFFVSPQRQNTDLAKKLGCEIDAGFVTCDENARTCVPGLYAAGNTSTGLQLAIIAAAEGAKAAHVINVELLERATRKR